MSRSLLHVNYEYSRPGKGIGTHKVRFGSQAEVEIGPILGSLWPEKRTFAATPAEVC
jgi:hypothetical protein